MSFLDDVLAQIDSSKEEEALHPELKQLLQELVDENEEIDGALVTSSDGHAQAVRLASEVDHRRLAAMSSAFTALGNTLCRETGKGTPRNLLIEGENGNIYLLQAGSTRVLTVFTRANYHLGMTLAKARMACQQIAKLAQ